MKKTAYRDNRWRTVPLCLYPILTSLPGGGGACPGFEFRISHKFLLTSVEVLTGIDEDPVHLRCDVSVTDVYVAA